MTARLSCWHCRHYIRPLLASHIDGPPGSICTMDRALDSYYADPDGMHPGDKPTPPTGWCARFELDPPPELPEYGASDRNRPATREELEAFAYRWGKRIRFQDGTVINPNFERTETGNQPGASAHHESRRR